MVDEMHGVKPRRMNLSLWAGLLLSVVGVLSYPIFFARFPFTRDIPWVNFLLLAVAAGLLLIGLRRAYSRSSLYRGKIVGPIFTVAGLALTGFFLFLVLVGSKRLPHALGAPQVGQKAPDFILQDISGRSVSLSGLLADAQAASAVETKGPRFILLIFYRGYW